MLVIKGEQHFSQCDENALTSDHKVASAGFKHAQVLGYIRIPLLLQSEQATTANDQAQSSTWVPSVDHQWTHV